MSIRTWVYAVALGITFAPQGAISQEGVQGSESAANTSASQQAEPEPPSFAPALDRIEAAIRDLIREESEEESKRIAEQAAKDLAAQTEMAAWAMDMAIASILSALFTFGGLVLIWRTLHHTRRAADATADMLIEAKRSAAAAEGAVDATRDVGEKQVRAYLQIRALSVTVGSKKGKIGASIEVTNSGQSPAIGVSAKIRIEAKHALQGVLEIPMPDVPANSTETRETNPLQVKAGAADLAGAEIINATAVVTAKDVFDQEIEAVAMRISRPPHGAKAGKTYDLKNMDGVFPAEAVKFLNTGMGRSGGTKSGEK